MRFVGHHPFVDPDAAVRKIAEIANGVEAVQDDGFPSSASMNRFSRQAAAPTSSARDRTRHRARLDMAARERHLCEVHRQRYGAVCLIKQP
jgi:hypothetical protein